MLKLEVFKFSADKESLFVFIKTEQNDIQDFFQANTDLVEYYLTKSTDLDEMLFVQHVPGMGDADEHGAVANGIYCIPAYKISWVMAYEEYRKTLEDELLRIEWGNQHQMAASSGKKYGFKGSGADATEMIDAWNRLQLITVDGEIANLKEIKEMWEGMFNMELGNIFEKKRMNHARKKEKTPFLNKMVKSLDIEKNRT